MGNQFWKDKKVLITGYEGFLGSHLTRTLLNFGARVWGLDIVVHRKRTILSDRELNTFKIIRGSVENFSLVSEIVKESKIEFIFHLAAQTIVGKCLRNPIRAFSTNIKGTWNILE
ncbi:MAG: GDP-mannose 4,6-dehydratase, partial [Sedimentisphaerales bacterium]